MGARKSRDPHDRTEFRALQLASAAGAAIAPDAIAGLTGAIRILRLTQVIQITGLQKTVIYDLQATGKFPMRVQLTPRSVGWIEEEVQLWLAQRVAVSRATRPEQLRPSPRKARTTGALSHAAAFDTPPRSWSR